MQDKTQNKFGLPEQLAALKPADKALGDGRPFHFEHERVRCHSERRLRGIVRNGANLPAVAVSEGSLHRQRGEEDYAPNCGCATPL